MALPLERTGGHEAQCVDARDQAGERGNGFRTLQRKQRALFQVVDGDGVGQRLAQVAEILVFGGAVHNHVEGLARRRGFACLAERMRFRQARHHQVVEDAAIVGEQQRIAHAVGRQHLEIARQQRLERLRHALAREEQLAHVADVEQAGVLARPQMLGHDAFILHRHHIAGEGYHPALFGAMPGVERQQRGSDRLQAVRILGGNRVAHSRSLRQVGHDADTGLPASPPPPLSRNLRAFAQLSRAYPFGGAGITGALSRVSLARAVPLA